MRLAFDLAHFWRLDPAAVMALPLSRLLLYATHADRIADEIESANRG